MTKFKSWALQLWKTRGWATLHATSPYFAQWIKSIIDSVIIMMFFKIGLPVLHVSFSHAHINHSVSFFLLACIHWLSEPPTIFPAEYIFILKMKCPAFMVVSAHNVSISTFPCVRLMSASSCSNSNCRCSSWLTCCCCCCCCASSCRRSGLICTRG